MCVCVYMNIYMYLCFSIANLAQVISQSGAVTVLYQPVRPNGVAGGTVPVPPATPFGRASWYNTATDLRAVSALWHRRHGLPSPPSDYIII